MTASEKLVQAFKCVTGALVHVMLVITPTHIPQVLMQLQMPASFVGPSYDESGWCHFESAVSSIIKPWDQRLTIQQSSGDEVEYATLGQNCKVARRPPVTPATFEQELRARSFTSGTDSNIVKELYDRTFHDLSHSVTRLCFRNLLWSLEEARLLSQTLPMFVNCVEVDLSHNPFGIHGIRVLMDKIADMARLRSLGLQHCRGMGVAEEVRTWSPPLRRMAYCKVLNLSENTFGDAGIAILAPDLRAMPKLSELQIVGCDIGPAGVAFLKEAHFGVDMLQRAGLHMSDLRDGGFTVKDCMDGGFSLESGVCQVRSTSQSSLMQASISATWCEHLTPGL